MSRPKQGQLFKGDPLDPVIAKIADRYVELVEEKAAVKERLEIQERNLVGKLKEKKLLRVTHKGHILELAHSEADKIHMKKVKELRKARQRNGKKEVAPE